MGNRGATSRHRADAPRASRHVGSQTKSSAAGTRDDEIHSEERLLDAELAFLKESTVRVHELASFVESKADSIYGPQPQTGSNSEAAPAPMGRAFMLSEAQAEMRHALTRLAGELNRLDSV